MTTDTCAFCEIVAGRAPAEVVSRWPNGTIAFRPLNPVTEHHYLVVPPVHVVSAADDPAIAADTMRCAAEFAGFYQAANIITSIGEAATQSVFHLHIHVIQRRAGDQLMVPWGTTGDPHAPHWCRVAEELSQRLKAVDAS